MLFSWPNIVIGINEITKIAIGTVKISEIKPTIVATIIRTEDCWKQKQKLAVENGFFIKIDAVTKVFFLG